MKSCLYEGQVLHKRYHPLSHIFKYSLFMVSLRLDELEEIFKPYWLWSIESWNLAYFRRRDHLGNAEVPLDQAVRDLVESKTGSRPEGPIQLMTHLSYFGFRFNPVSFYFCWSKDESTVENIIAEINNTPWGEQHCYVLKVNKQNQDGTNQFVFGKEFHISPFMDMKIKYVWTFSELGDKCRIHMENWDGNQKLLDVSLAMIRSKISHTSLARALIRYPFMTMKVVWGIYYQALRLWMKHCPFYSHPKFRKDSKILAKQFGEQ